MLGAIAHDLGTPITRLRLRAEFVEDEQLRAKMLRDLDDMQHMVSSTLAFIREEATSEPRAMVDLGSLLARVCDDIQDTGANVQLAAVERGILLECRPVGLRRALGNLIDNAVKYGSLARVAMHPEAEIIRIFVDDEGPGIPESRHDDVFQPFRRLDASRNLDICGTGLGLAITRTIVRAHGGDIVIENRPGGGLRAGLRLPRFVSQVDKTSQFNGYGLRGITGTLAKVKSKDNHASAFPDGRFRGILARLRAKPPRLSGVSTSQKT